jgi:drug/metabolite transporter (DMT)-like permease
LTLSPSARGIALMLVAMAVFSAMDGLSKELTAHLDPIEIAWGRFVFHGLFLLPMVLAHGWRQVIRPHRISLQIGRGVLMLGSGLFFIGALGHMPMAEAATLGFVAPLMVAVLSVPMLGERVAGRCWIAIAGGFGGVLVVMRPGAETFDPAALLPILSSACWAVALILTRRIGTTDAPLTTQVWTALASLAVTSLLVPWVWKLPDPPMLAAMAGMGLCSLLGQYLLILAFTTGRAAVLAPFQYSQLLWSGTIGWLWFGTAPDPWTWIGAGVLVVSGVYLWHDERRATAS